MGDEKQLERLARFFERGNRMFFAGDSLARQSSTTLACRLEHVLTGGDVRPHADVLGMRFIYYPLLTLGDGPLEPLTFAPKVTDAFKEALAAPSDKAFIERLLELGVSDELGALLAALSSPPARGGAGDVDVLVASMGDWVSEIKLGGFGIVGYNVTLVYRANAIALMRAGLAWERDASADRRRFFVYRDLFPRSAGTGCNAQEMARPCIASPDGSCLDARESHSLFARRLAADMGVRVLDTFGALRVRNDAKVGMQVGNAVDCLHYCMGNGTPLLAVAEAFATMLDVDLGVL